MSVPTDRPGHDPYHGHGSRERLEYWLDGQVEAEQLTEAQARMFLPDYERPGHVGCLLLVAPPIRDQDDDGADDGSGSAAGWGG